MTHVPRRNRVDPFSDLHSVPARGIFMGNRGCLVDDDRRLVRHHQGQLWIICVTSYKDWKSPLDQPRHWTPIFFLDDAVALAAGHRPCGLCRYREYRTYQKAVQTGLELTDPPSATDLNRMLGRERLRRGGGMSRAEDRILWTADIATLPNATVIVGEDRVPQLIVGDGLHEFSFDGWKTPSPRPGFGEVDVLTPRTSVIALENGYSPVLHHTASEG